MSQLLTTPRLGECSSLIMKFLTFEVIQKFNHVETLVILRTEFAVEAVGMVLVLPKRKSNEPRTFSIKTLFGKPSPSNENPHLYKSHTSLHLWRFHLLDQEDFFLKIMDALLVSLSHSWLLELFKKRH